MLSYQHTYITFYLYGKYNGMLINGSVGHNKYNIFLIYEPKCRLVMSLFVKDKLINHFVTRYILEKKLT